MILPSSSRGSDWRKACEKPPILLVSTMIVLTNSIDETFALVNDEREWVGLTKEYVKVIVSEVIIQCSSISI